MNGPHDVGGQMGFGSISPEPNEPVFHAEWEGRAFGLVLCSGALKAWTNGRFARESIPPALYYAASYYEIWIRGLETCLLQSGLITNAEMAAGRPLEKVVAPGKPLKASDIPVWLTQRGSYVRPIVASNRFEVGDIVSTRNMHPPHHTRLPRYARGKVGTIDAVHEGYVLPDSLSRGLGESPEHLYTVKFTATELWGSDGDPNSTVRIDAWESYLERA